MMQIVVEPDRGLAFAASRDDGIVAGNFENEVSIGVDSTSTPGFPTACAVCSIATVMV